MKVPAAAIALCGFVIAATACAPTADQAPATGEAAATDRAPAADEAAATEADVEALKALEETVVAAFKAGEIDPLAALYAEDVVVLAPNQSVLVGKDAVLAWLQGLYDQLTVDEFTSSFEEVVVADAWAFSRGEFGWTLSMKGGGEPMAGIELPAVLGKVSRNAARLEPTETEVVEVEELVKAGEP